MDDAAAAPAASIPVFLNRSLPEGARLELFQYQLYPRGRPLPVPASAAQRGQRVASRWRPHANRVEIELPLDMRETVYNREKGAALAEACAPMGAIGVPGETAIKQERGIDAPPPRFDRIRLESADVPNATRYFVGTVHNNEMHLTPLDAVLQLRPSMQHVDMLHQADEHERRRAAAGGSDEEAEQPQEQQRVVSLNVSLRSDARSARTGAHSSRDAEAERWLDLQWCDSSADALQAQSRAQPRCTTTALSELL